MDLNPIAHKLAAYGKEEAAALRIAQRGLDKAKAIHAERCAFLTTLMTMPTPDGCTPLTETTVALSVAPKDQ